MVDDDYQSTDSDQDNSPAKELKTKKKKQAKYDTEEAADTTVDLTTLDSPTIFENSKKKTRFTVHDDDNNND